MIDWKELLKLLMFSCAFAAVVLVFAIVGTLLLLHACQKLGLLPNL